MTATTKKFSREQPNTKYLSDRSPDGKLVSSSRIYGVNRVVAAALQFRASILMLLGRDPSLALQCSRFGFNFGIELVP